MATITSVAPSMYPLALWQFAIAVKGASLPDKMDFLISAHDPKPLNKPFPVLTSKPDCACPACDAMTQMSKTRIKVFILSLARSFPSPSDLLCTDRIVATVVEWGISFCIADQSAIRKRRAYAYVLAPSRVWA